MRRDELKDFLDAKFNYYNRSDFIHDDPVSIPHEYTFREDIEISGLMAALFAWGNRKTIIKKSRTLMQLMDDSPFEFVTEHSAADLKRLKNFAHRTFNAHDCIYLVKALQFIYQQMGGLESLFTTGFTHGGAFGALTSFRKAIMTLDPTAPTGRHIADVENGSAAKRVNMFLRWMVRRDPCGVDFGIWTKISPSELMCPLDVHSGRVARSLGLLSCRQNNWNATMELTSSLRTFDPTDPVKYDFALFGLGVNEGFA